jgi:tRNA (guanosine-2'-O-)-methyltransferase
MGLSVMEYRLLDHLGQYITAHRRELIDQVLRFRTRQITVVLENIHQSHNASAVVRSCECFGVQDIHIIEEAAPYQVNKKVLKGSYKWVNLIRYKSSGQVPTKVCFDSLQENGYAIFATDPNGSISIDELDPTVSKIALVFGNEDAGVSDYGRLHSNALVRIPMFGFTESFNISVSVALCLNVLMKKLHAGAWTYGLSGAEHDVLKLAWYRKVVKRSDLIEKRFLQSNT